MYDQLYPYIEYFSTNFYVASVRLTPFNMFFIDYYNNDSQS